MNFKDLPTGRWFRYRGRLYQRLRNLNGSNAYCAGDFGSGSTYAYIEPNAQVEPSFTPTHENLLRGNTLIILPDGTWKQEVSP